MKANKQAMTIVGVAALIISGALIAKRQIEHARVRTIYAYHQWHAITVNRSTKDVRMEGEELEPLMRLSEAIEITIHPAPGKRGTEIAARLTTTGDLTDKDAIALLGKLRVALRNTQSLLETGEILSPDTPPSTHRTLRSLPLQFAVRHAREGGRL